MTSDEIQPKKCFHWCHVELEWMEEVHVALFFGSDLFVSKRYRPFLVAFIFPMSHRDKKLIKKCTDLYCSQEYHHATCGKPPRSLISMMIKIVIKQKSV